MVRLDKANEGKNMEEVKIPHNTKCKSESHDKHLCCMVSRGALRSEAAKYKELVKDAEFICLYCGRSAKDIESLCVPERL